ncbi:MAG: TolC family protein, partial [Myxococcales bacterium]|nr:TolC family protein [Myxococcales bacterium]
GRETPTSIESRETPFEAAPDLPANPTLTDYLAYAEARNPGLQAARASWEAAGETAAQAGAPPDPRLTYGYYFQKVETRAGPQRNSFAVSQMIPWYGKLDLRSQAAADGAEAARARYAAARLALRAQVVNAFAELYYLARAITVTRESVELLTYWERVATAKYRAAAGSYADVIRAQVELGKLTDRVRTFEDLRTPTAAALNEAIDRPSDAPLPWPADLPATPVVLDERRLLADLPETSPELGALDAEVRRQTTAVDIARKDYWPDVTLGVQWIDTGNRPSASVPDEGKDPLIGTVSINVPLWWEKYAAAEREARARRLAASLARAGRARSLETSLQLALYKFRDAARKVGLYRDGLVPKAEQAIAATFTAYESGEANFLDVLDAERVLLEFGLALERARTDQVQRLAEIEMLVGRPVATAAPEERP